MQNKVVAAIIIVLVALLLLGGIDGCANAGKAYGNVSINGIDVSGMNEQEMRSMLEQSVGEKVRGTEITIEAPDKGSNESSSSASAEADERDLLSESVMAEYSDTTTSWTATSESLHASLPYDDAIKQAMDAGRTGGPLGRIALFFTKTDIPFEVSLDSAAVESLASNIDKSAGDIRVDATVVIEDGVARVLPGRDGKMVDRNWLTGQLKECFMSDSDANTITASVVDAPSRTSLEQAQEVCDIINQALKADAEFSYRSKSWTADGTVIGDWTKVVVDDSDGTAKLKILIDPAAASQELVQGLGATVSSDDVVVKFEVDGDTVNVKTSGSGVIPEIDSALKSLEEQLYGENGYGRKGGESSTIKVIVSETDAPEALTFNEALSLGLITVIGEYTTEFDDSPGTENRNHNIKLATELLNNTVCEGNGGRWSFNEHSGDTNADPPFASAGSIVNGEFVDSIGGGICQVATTVFNAVYEAGLDIDERRNHSIYIASYPDGRDSTIDYPNLDLVWSNPLPSDVLVKTSHTDTSVTVQLYSVYTGYRVESETGPWEEGAKYQTTFETDSNLASGQSYQKKAGEDGKKISVTRTVYDKDNKLVSQNVFSSEYPAQNEVYVVGPGTDTSSLGRNASSSSSSNSGGQHDSSSSAYSDATSIYGTESTGAYTGENIYGA